VVNNLDTWKEAVEKLRDLRIYTVEDLTTELIEINQERARRAEETLARVIQAKDAEIAVLKQQASFTMAFSAYRHIEAIQNTIAGVPELVQKFITDCDKLLDGQKPR
jgi:succinylglutamate desuccinylase